MLKVSGKQVNEVNPKSLDVENGGCIQVTGMWENEWNSSNASIYCDMSADDQSKGKTLKITYDGKTVADETGTWELSNVEVKLGQIKKGSISFSDICVEFTGAPSVTCLLI